MRLQRALAWGFALLLVNSGWVWAFPEASLFYVGNVVLHLGLGWVLLVALWRANSPLVAALRRDSRPLLFVLSLAGGLGLVLAVIGATRPNYSVVIAHGAAGFVGAALLWRWLRRSGATDGAHLIGGALVLALTLPLVGALRDTYFPREADRIANPLSPPATMEEEGAGADSVFFPSASNTNTGDYIPADFFLDSKLCGDCHTSIYEQWSSSSHHLSSFNNQFYRKSIEYLQDVGGLEQSKWCAGCHDHAMFFNGRFEKPVKEQIDTPEAQAGLGCMSCHAIVHVNDTMGNGGFVVEYPELHDLAMSDNPVIAALQKYVTNTAPAAHRRQFLKPFMKEPEFCSTCHKVHLDQPVNKYRWLRGFNEYDSWQASGVSGHGARSFYYPPEPQDCADCHMPLVPGEDPSSANGLVHSHRFPAANTALAYVSGEQEQLEATEQFLQSGIVSLDIFAVSPIAEAIGRTAMRRTRAETPQAATSFAVGEEAGGISAPAVIREVGMLSAPLDRSTTAVRPGETVRVDVVLRTRSVGHFFPGGTVDSVDCWVELRAVDASGRDVFWSGQVLDEGRGAVEPGAHFLRSVMLDEHGNRIDKRNAFHTRSLLYARLIPPGAADVSHFRITIPEQAVGPISLQAKVNYRKFSHSYTAFSYAGEPVDDEGKRYGEGYDDRRFTYRPEDIPANVSGVIRDRIPSLPITVMAEAEAELLLADTEPQWAVAVQAEDAERWNDYGIGLLLQGDLKGAEHAFLRVTEARPEWADGWLNVGRALIEEGQAEGARPYVERALELGPDLARVQYFLALIHRAAGEFDIALQWLRKASDSYPRDRVVLNQIGGILFLQRQYSEAIEVLDRVAAIDPEDLQMHYTRMRAFRGLGQAAQADHEEKLFRRYKADESAQTRTAKIRRLSPEDNNERQSIHEHVSAPLPTSGRAAEGDDD